MRKTELNNPICKRESFGRRFMKKMRFLKNPILLYAGLSMLITCVSYIWAFYIAFATSLKTINAFLDDFLGWPEKPVIENYLRAFVNLYIMVQTDMGQQKIPFIELLKNSVLLSTIPVVVTVTSRAMVAYVVTKYKRFKFNKVLHFFVVFVIVFPSAGSLGASINFLKELGFYDSYWALLWGNIGFADGSFLMWAGAWRGVSSEYMEAAKIDGAGHWKIFWSVMFPMIRVQYFIFLALNFITEWGDYNRVLTTMPSYSNLALGLWKFQFSTTNIISWPPVQMAAVILVSIPCIIIFLILEPHLEGNITTGGLKG